MNMRKKKGFRFCSKLIGILTNFFIAAIYLQITMAWKIIEKIGSMSFTITLKSTMIKQLTKFHWGTI